MASYDQGSAVLSGINAALPYVDSEEIFRRARGVIAETIPVNAVGSTGQIATGVASYIGVALRPGNVITNINTYVSAAGSGVTLSKTALYSKTGVQLATSADQGTSWQSIGFKSIAMATPYVVSVADVYYLSILTVFSTTAPSFPRGSFNVGLGPFAIGANASHYYCQSGLSDFPTPATYSSAIVVGSGSFYLNAS